MDGNGFYTEHRVSTHQLSTDTTSQCDVRLGTDGVAFAKLGICALSQSCAVGMILDDGDGGLDPRGWKG